ncbi:MAG: flagellar biosynthesis regulator FlaF [Rhodobacteraceae bacterium]|nr:flagellar biosynthesis regulator FlaF [Paracoccaceae bacterium]
MNALDLAKSAYATVGTPLRSARATEYEVIAQITRRLRATERRRKDAFPAFAEALHDNLRLWTTLANDVADPENRLTPALRARIFYLYEFTMRQSRLALGTDAGVEVLVDINTAVMRGLRGGGEDA